MKKSIWIKTLSMVLVVTLLLTVTPLSLTSVNAFESVITRAEWFQENMDLFDMTIEKNNYPHNNFTDIDAQSPYYRDVMPSLTLEAAAAAIGDPGGISLVPDLPTAKFNGFIVAIDAPDPSAIKIYNEQDLWDIRNNLSGSYVLMADLDLSKINGGEWVPIGDNATDSFSSRFSGTLDGQGYKIRNLKIMGNQGNEYSGLFGYASNATFKNIGLENINITKGNYAGGICGYAPGSLISNCYSKGAVTVSNSAVTYAGGICGYASVAGYISNCYNTVAVSATATNNNTSYAGGITGYNTGVANSCYNTGEITSLTSGTNDSYTSSFSYAGGISGYSTGSADFCHNSGIISSSSNRDAIYPNSYAGGIFGYGSKSVVSNCRNTGKVSGSSCDDLYVGGICGYINNGSVIQCYNTGVITAHATASNSTYAGGICGYATTSSYIINCGNIADVAASITRTSNSWGHAGGTCGQADSTVYIRECNNTGNITGDSYAGGICSYGYSISITSCENSGKVTASFAHYSDATVAGGIIAQSGNATTIANCKNTADVSSSSDTTSSSDSTASYAGGIVGYYYIYYSSGNGTIRDCSNTGKVTASSGTSSTVSDGSFAGGICGSISTTNAITIQNSSNTGDVSAPAYFRSYAGGICGRASISSSFPITISDCYSIGNQTASSTSYSSGAYAGGICGSSSATVKNCYSNCSPSATAYTSSNAYVGGVCGSAASGSTISGCYWNKDNITVGFASGKGTVTPLTTGEMKQKISFAAFDFDTVWDINSSVNNGYPTLRPSFYPVTNITDVPKNATAGVPLALFATVVPTATTKKAVTWSVKSTGTTGASISSSGVTLNTKSTGTVTLVATIIGGGEGGANYTQDFTITVLSPFTPVDKLPLFAKIKEANNLTETKYTSTSWTALKTLLNSSKAVLDNDSATQAQIDNAMTSLQTVINNLVDTSTLAALIAQASALKQADYTPASWAALSSALTVAIGVIENNLATKTLVNSAVSTLEAAILSLETSQINNVTIIVTAGIGGSVSGGGIVKTNTKTTLTATADSNSGYIFDGWYENNIKVSGAGAIYTFTAAANRTLEARFIIPAVDLSFLDGEVRIWAESGVVPWDAVFEVIKTMPPPDEVVEIVKDYYGSAAIVIGYYEITLEGPGGVLITRLDGDLTISIKLPDGYENSKGVKIAQIDDGGKVTAASSGTSVITAEMPDGSRANVTIVVTLPGELTLGDVNGDGQLTVVDIVRLRAAIMNDIVLTEEQRLVANVDGDSENQLTVTDIVALRKLIMGD